MIKQLKPSLIPILHPLLNICKYKGYHPKIWKTVFALLFNKPNKPQSNPSNYRPISLISRLSKIIEKIITTQIYHWAETNNILNKEQAGFRKNKSTTDKLFQLSLTISQAKNQRRPSSAIFLGVEKAFDKVWHDGLIHKLLFLNTPLHLLRYINNYISNRSMFFAINNTTSPPYPPSPSHSTMEFPKGAPSVLSYSSSTFQTYLHPHMTTRFTVPNLKTTFATSPPPNTHDSSNNNFKTPSTKLQHTVVFTE